MSRTFVSAAARRGAVVACVVVLGVLPLITGCDPDPFPGYLPGSFAAHGSVDQVWVTDATPGAQLSLADHTGVQVASATADAKGSTIFRDVAPGQGYRVIASQPWKSASISTPVTVLGTASAPPDPAIYNQSLNVGGWSGHEKDGYGYLTTRDGTKLSIMVRLPGPPEDGPYPTVIEYSGYTPADPDSPQPMTQIMGLFGYATVGINIRGTGCSGGAFDYFETLQSLDGYDAIETIARQPWVMHHKVGMVGISYPGISQLFVGATEPPSLAAIAPLSVIDNTATTLYPGGILNDGFALSWGEDRVHDSQEGGQGWSRKRMENGDQTCIDNQKLRLQTPDLLAKISANTHYDPAVADQLNPSTFVDRIRVPRYLACQWQDEQTGGHCADLVPHFTGTQDAWFTFTNGTHFDSLDPAQLVRMYDFLELFVAQRKPTNTAAVRGLAPLIYDYAASLKNLQLPPDPMDATADYSSALAMMRSWPRVRVLFDNGSGSATPGNPVPGFEASFGSFPVSGVHPQAWYLGPDGSLTATPPTAPAAADAYAADATRAHVTSFDGSTSDVWVALPQWQWTPPSAGTALVYETAPLTSDQVMVGNGSVDLWVRSSAADTDLQATLSEIRPDGQEELIQSGWLRASNRKVDAARSTALWPVENGYASDSEPMPAGQYQLLRIPLYPFGHAARAGSRLRITMSSPGGDRPFWEFSQPPVAGQVTNTVARSATLPSRIVLPVVPGLAVPTPLPACVLRGQPCRTAATWVNTPGAP